MSNEARQLTPEDPVSPETLEQLAKLVDARGQMADHLLDLEQRKIQILASVKRIDEQHARLIESVLVDRGLLPTDPVEIDTKTGRLKILREKQE